MQDQGADLGMTYGQTPMETGSIRTTVHPSQQHSMHQTQGGRSAQSASTVGVQQQRSFSSSEEERSTPECASDEPDESEKGKWILQLDIYFSSLYNARYQSSKFILYAQYKRKKLTGYFIQLIYIYTSFLRNKFDLACLKEINYL